MRFIAMAMLVAGLSVVLRRHPFALVLTGLVLQLLLPSVLITGQFMGPSAISAHPGSLIVLFTFVLQLVLRPNVLLAAWARSAELVLVLGAVLAAMFGQSVLGGGGGAPSFVLDQIGAPVAAALLLAVEFHTRPGREAVVRAVILALGVAESLLSLAQTAAGSILLFESAFATQSWYTGTVERWMGTTDHPLVLSLMLVCCIPLLAEVRRWYISMPIMMILVSGILVTQSRTGAALAALACAYVLLRGRASLGVRSVMWGAAAVFGVAALASGMLDGVLFRFGDTRDLSTIARQMAAANFWTILPDYLWSGRGVGASFAIAREQRLLSSYENSFFMLTLDFGLVATALYFVAMFGCLLLGLLRHAPRGWVLAGFLVIVEIVSFSALGVRTSIPMFMWVVLGTAAFSGTGRRAVDPTSTWALPPRTREPAPVGGAW